jgi:hypothetical protein
MLKGVPDFLCSGMQHQQIFYVPELEASKRRSVGGRKSDLEFTVSDCRLVSPSSKIRMDSKQVFMALQRFPHCYRRDMLRSMRKVERCLQMKCSHGGDNILLWTDLTDRK